jgi:hypothetical protein
MYVRDFHKNGFWWHDIFKIQTQSCSPSLHHLYLLTFVKSPLSGISKNVYSLLAVLFEMHSLSDPSVTTVRWKDKCTVYAIALLFYILQKCTSQNLLIFRALTFTSSCFICTSVVHSHHICINDNRKLKGIRWGRLYLAWCSKVSGKTSRYMATIVL